MSQLLPKDLWLLPHIQQMIAAQKKDEEEGGRFLGYDNDGLAIWLLAIDKVKKQWSKKVWSISFRNNVYLGHFERIEQHDFAYIDCLEEHEVFYPITIKVPLQGNPLFWHFPIEEANVKTIDDRGWPVALYVFGKELWITAHPAAFRVKK